MTGMLASVCSEREAQLVRRAGVDIIDLKDPRRGALGALDTELVRRIVGRTDRSIPCSATIGDIPYRADLIETRIGAMAEAGVAFVKVGVFGDPYDADVLRMLRGLSGRGIRIVLVLFAEDALPSDFHIYARHGIAGVMLDTRDKQTGSLRDKQPDRRLRAFVAGARRARLICGLAGSLAAADIPFLRGLGADYLGFRGALCRGRRRTGRLDAGLVRQLRASLSGGEDVGQCA
jgi:uncharacterized protein (UPF0264 family)